VALQAVQTELTAYPPGDATAHTRIARTRRCTQLLAAINAAITTPDLHNPQLQQLSNALTALKNDRKLLITAGKKIKSWQQGNIRGSLFNSVHEGGTVGTYQL
jgi:hypothetical protein